MISLSDKQLKAAKAIAAWFRDPHRDESNFFYLAGFAGTGKSTILPTIIDYCQLDLCDVAFCAPTGKAAKVMSQKLREQFPGTTGAKTIHSLIYMPRPEAPDAIEAHIIQIKAKIKVEDDKAHSGGSADLTVLKSLRNDLATKEQELEDAYHNSDKPRFSLNLESSVREKRLIVVDEASMVGDSITDDLIKFGVPILAIGDPEQLPPVGDHPGFTAGRPDFFLDEIHRQALDNPIIQLTMDIRAGKSIRPCTMGDAVRIVTRRDDRWSLNPDYDAMLICGTHRKRFRLVGKIRNLLGYDSTGPMEGEPLIMTRNSRKNSALVNGTFVRCLKDAGNLINGKAAFPLNIRDEDGQDYNIRCVQEYFEAHVGKGKNVASAEMRDVYKAKKEEEHIDFGWAITCHKAQGSQWDNVIVHDESSVFRKDASRWLYTAATRAAKELTIVI